ncbi:MAG: fibronectin type III domain-containing protein, partial [Spirochaetes bacterium]|nr:fibronectin type III domain-containing protein [Spirochaetota bacterium]
PGQMKITWFSADDDSDSLIYSVYFKFKNDSTWYLLRNRFYKNTLIFNTSLLPNSRYTFKITASDLPSNTDLTYKTGSKESRSFLVDHSEPLIKNLKVKHSGNKIIISGIAKDEWSIITKLKYTLNVKQWRNINPIDDVYDSKTEKFRIVIDKKANPFLVNGKNILIIRAQDKYANWITEKVVFNVKLNTTDRGFINNNLYFKKHHN